MMQEDSGKIGEKTLEMRRAIDSLREELEAIDHYNQRADATGDENLKKILIHNANEEKEHAAMLSAWLKQNDPEFEKEFDEYMNMTDTDIAGKEEEKKE